MDIVVFWEEGFPFVDTVAWTQEALRSAANEQDTVRFVGTTGLAEALTNTQTVLVTPYGSAFPKAVWSVIYDFLNRGGSWVNLGGSPLSRPVRKNQDGSWHVEVSTTAYSKELFLNQAFPIELHGDEKYQWMDSLSTAAYGLDASLKCARAWTLQPRFADTRDFPREHGTGGTRDARLRPQIYVLRDGRRIAAPIVVIDRLRGPFAGGSWILVNAELTEPLDTRIIRALFQQAALGPIELEVCPSFACYYRKEGPPTLNIRVKLHRFSSRLVARYGTVQDGEWGLIEDYTLGEVQAGMPQSSLATLPDFVGGVGLHTVRVELRSEGAEEILATAETGFWGYDETLLTSGKPLTVNRDYFERDGEPYPIMGTTYMGGRHSP